VETLKQFEILKKKIELSLSIPIRCVKLSLSEYIKKQKYNHLLYSRYQADPYSSLSPHSIYKLKSPRHPSSYVAGRKLNEKNKKRTPLLASIMIGVTVFTVLSIIASIIVSGWISEIDSGCDANVEIRFGIFENDQYWRLSIAEVWGGTLFLDQATFQLLNYQYYPIVNIDDKEIQNIKPIVRVDAKFYPVAAPDKFNPYGKVLIKNTEGIPIDKQTKISDYNGCSLLFIDEDNNGQINIDDSICIFKDWNFDGTSEIKVGCTFRILNSAGNIVGERVLR